MGSKSMRSRNTSKKSKLRSKLSSKRSTKKGNSKSDTDSALKPVFTPVDFDSMNLSELFKNKTLRYSTEICNIRDLFNDFKINQLVDGCLEKTTIYLNVKIKLTKTDFVPKTYNSGLEYTDTFPISIVKYEIVSANSSSEPKYLYKINLHKKLKDKGNEIDDKTIVSVMLIFNEEATIKSINNFTDYDGLTYMRFLMKLLTMFPVKRILRNIHTESLQSKIACNDNIDNGTGFMTQSLFQDDMFYLFNLGYQINLTNVVIKSGFHYLLSNPEEILSLHDKLIKEFKGYTVKEYVKILEDLLKCISNYITEPDSNTLFNVEITKKDANKQIYGDNIIYTSQIFESSDEYKKNFLIETTVDKIKAALKVLKGHKNQDDFLYKLIIGKCENFKKLWDILSMDLLFYTKNNKKIPVMPNILFNKLLALCNYNYIYYR